MALRRKALFFVSYERTAYEGTTWRVTFDRLVLHKSSTLAVSLEGLLVPGVVVEVKGNPPKWILKALGRRNKKFSKSRWAQESE